MEPEDERELEKLKKDKRKAEKNDNLKEVALIHNCIGELYSKYERYDEAIKEHEAERALSEALQDRIGEAVSCRKIGECYCALELYDKALKLQQRHLSLAQLCSSDIEVQRAWATIGRTYLFQSETFRGKKAREASENAEKAFTKALGVCDKLKGSVKEVELMEMRARLYLNLGLVCDGRGNLRQSAEYLKKAITIAQKYHLMSDVYRCQFSLAGMYQRSENWSQALRSLEEAQNCALKMKDKLLERDVLPNKAQILLIVGDYSMAKHCLKKAYKLGSATTQDEKRIMKMFKAASKIEDCMDDLNKENVSLNDRFRLNEMLGDAAADIGNFKQAIDFYTKMLECGDELQIGRKQRIPIYVSLAQTYADNKQYTKAVEYYKLELSCRVDEPEQSCRTWLNIAEAVELGDSGYEKTIQCYLSAFDLARKAKNAHLQIQVLKSLLEVQKSFKQENHQKQTKDRLTKLRSKFGIQSGDELSDSELDTQQSEEGEDDNLSIADLTESECSDEEPTAATATGSVRRQRTAKPRVNEKGETPLHRACIEGNLKKVKALLEKGHPVNPRDYCGWIPLHEAANHDQVEIVKYLLENGAAVNDRGGKHCGGITPLIDAANCGNMEVMEALLNHGASVYNKDDEGQTALDCLHSWYQRCDDTLSRELQQQYSHIEAKLSGGWINSRSARPADVVHANKSDVLDLYDDERVRSPSLPELKSSTKRKRTSIGKSKTSRNVILSESEGDWEGSDEEVALVSEMQDSEDFYPNPRLDDLKTSITATENYQKAMCSIGSASQRASVRVPSSKSSSRKSQLPEAGALLDADIFIDDDWLIDDIRPQKRKKLDMGGVFSSSRTRNSAETSSGDNVKHKRSVINDDDDSSRETIQSGSDVMDLDPNFSDVIFNSDRTNSKKSKLSTKSKSKQMKLTSFTTNEHNVPSQSSNLPVSSQNGGSTLLDFPSSHSTSVQGDISVSVSSIMRLKVTIDGQMLLVPVPDSNESISWLAQDVSRRYEKIHQKKPLITLRTRDGAILSPDDVISMVLANNEVLDAMVDSWDMQPLPERYRQACKAVRGVEYRNIVTLLQSCDGIGSLDLRNLSLRPGQILPVFRGLEGQNNLKILNIQSNRVGDHGMLALCKCLMSLPNLSSLNLSGNEITAVGLKTLADMLESGHQTGNKPLQSLMTLNLSHNPGGDNSTSHMTRLLSYLPSLTELFITACQFTAKFFSQHRLTLATAMKESSLQKLDISHNALGSLGLEQLLRCLDHKKTLSLDLSETHAGASISHLTLHIQQYVTQTGCVLEDLRLSACHLTQDDSYFLTRLPSIYKALRKITVSRNLKIDNGTIQLMLQESVKNDSSLEEIVAQGCTIQSPLDSHFLDSLNDKLSSCLHPVRRFVFTCVNLDKVDVDSLNQIWTDRWKDLAHVNISGDNVDLCVMDAS